jgi:hypothetical protein
VNTEYTKILYNSNFTVNPEYTKILYNPNFE